MATKKKEEELAAPEAQSGYDTSGLENRQQVEEAMAGAGYRPGQSVTNAANALKEWQDKRPEAYQSSYQDRINEVLDRLLARENFAYSYTQDPLYRQYAQQYTQNAHNASADAAAQAAALTGGYGSSYAASAAQQPLHRRSSSAAGRTARSGRRCLSSTPHRGCRQPRCRCFPNTPHRGTGLPQTY